MIRNSFKIIVFAVGIFLSGNNVFANNNFKILANINEVAITEADLKAFMKITKNNDRKKALKEYMELIQNSKIADLSGIKLSRKDKAEYWSKFKMKNIISQTKKEFCRKNGINEDFLDNYIKMTAVWEIYYDNFIARSVKIEKDTIVENMKITGKAKTENSYELSGIILNYSTNKQKKEIKTKLENIFTNVKTNSISFPEATKSITTPKTKKSDYKTKKDDNYLGWVNKSDFNDLFTDAIEKTNVGDITNPVCTENNDKGSCVIFVVHNSKSVTNTNEKEEIRTFSEFYKKAIGVKTIEIVASYNDVIKVKCNL